MFRNHLKVAVRQLLKNKSHSWINILGLASGLAVVLLIGLWIADELTFDHYHPNHSKIVQAMQSRTSNDNIRTTRSVPYPIGDELRKSYGGDFKYVVMASWNWEHILSYENKKVMQAGNYMEPQAPDMLSLSMLSGSRDGLKDPSSILLSGSAAKALFGDADPIGKTVSLDNKLPVKVTGVYEDLPYNTTFKNLSFIAPWSLYATSENWIKHNMQNWGNNSFQLFAQVADNTDVDKISARIKDIKLNRVDPSDRKYKPTIFLQSMDRWHLYSEFKYGKNAGGRIQFVWLFGIIGAFVLLLACINFMNLSTARSEKRAKEVGIRKAVGSIRGQLIGQFLSESILVATLSMLLAIMLTQISLPFFNEVADKKMQIPWTSVYFWMLAAGVCVLTGLLAGSYPALYLSSFKPVKILKGTWKAGRFAATPRKVLVVLQFSVSIILIIGTIVVFRQIQFAKDRPVGYDREGLITIPMLTPDLHEHFTVVRDELRKSRTIIEMAESNTMTTQISVNNGGLDWKGKDPNMSDDFAIVGVSPEYGKTIDWQIKQGRDFSKAMGTDSSGIILNEAAVEYMGLKEPVGENVRWAGKTMTVIGVIKNMLMQSPYEPVKQTIYAIDVAQGDFLHVKLNPALSSNKALAEIERIYKSYSPATPFTYMFVDEEYARKFDSEERIGRLSGFFTILAIFICCLGLFGMASFMAEQRIKEIGVRKVLGASVFNLWRLLSKDFVMLVVIAIVIAMPIAYYFMNDWLRSFNYKTALSAWIFLAAGAGALIITLLTVSYQSIKAALMNPVKSLKVD